MSGVRINLGPLLFPEVAKNDPCRQGQGHSNIFLSHPRDDFGDSPRDSLFATLDATEETKSTALLVQQVCTIQDHAATEPSSIRSGDGKLVLRQSKKGDKIQKVRRARSAGMRSSSTEAPSEASPPLSRLPSLELVGTDPASSRSTTPVMDEGVPGFDSPASSGEDGKTAQQGPHFEHSDTTVMLRNIPNKYTASALKDEFLSAGFEAGVFDFFYLPVDFGTKRNLGYCFVNFCTTSDRKRFVGAFHNQRLGQHSKQKILQAVRATTQGYELNFAQFRRKDARRIRNELYKPQIFHKEDSTH
jgi:hypothetical protein